MTSIKFRALTHNDHKLFFEALGEHGKDFQNIQQYMAQKCGKSGNKSSDQNKSIDPQEKKEQDKKEEDKKREQIRNFYNKLYTKLSQLVGKLDDRIEKVNQELYLLINYGEIWKKHGFKFNNKTKKLLEELVYQGYTTLRFKNKNVRLRTPSCKALKKINEIGVDEKVKVVTTRELPKDVVVEFHPASNRDWIKVQSMAQNPLVRARLSIQKRLSNILEFLEYKWNISPIKLSRTVDLWLKVSPNTNQQSIEDLQQQQSLPNNASNGYQNNSLQSECNNSATNIGSSSSEQNPSTSNNDIHLRLRLKPSAQHELKEVNITRVVPDNHLDLSLNAYIKRFGESIVKNREQSVNKSNNNKDAYAISSHNVSNDGVAVLEPLELSLGAMSSSSRLPISLTTPDSSILLERSCTSDQPSIARVRKQLNLLQSFAGSFEGCENSRTACEDTQDRSFLIPPMNENSSNRIVSFADAESNKPSSMTINSNIPALFDEDAAIETNLPIASQGKISTEQSRSQKNLNPQSSDDQNSKSVDFAIPTNLTLGDWFTKMTGHSGCGDDANDAFPINQVPDESEKIVVESDNKDCNIEFPKIIKAEPFIVAGNSTKPHNHMIDVMKLAKGWTRQDESSMTIGELYLAFKCPEKILLEYEFEQFKFNSPQMVQDSSTSTTNSTTVIPCNQSNNEFIFKLLTAASLSLAHIEHQRQEQLRLQEQSGAKLKRRKGPSNPNTIKYLKRDDALPSNSFSKATASGLQSDCDGPMNNQNSIQHNAYNNNYINTNNEKNQGQGQGMTLLDIEATNQRVEEALKQLQPTRLSVFRRAR